MQSLYRLLGRQFAHYRLKAGLTQEQLAEKTDYSKDFISLVERGVNAPTLARLQVVAKVVGVEVWQLFHYVPDEELVTERRARKGKRKSKSGR